MKIENKAIIEEKERQALKVLSKVKCGPIECDKCPFQVKNIIYNGICICALSQSLLNILERECN